MKQLFLNRERIACMFLCVCARAVCVCNLSLFVRKAFLPPHRSGSPLSAVLTHLFHFACIALAPSPSSLLLRSLAFFPLCRLPHPSPLLVSSRLSFSVFCSRPKKNQTWLFCLGVLSASSWSDDLPPPGVESEKPSCVKFTTGRMIFSKHLASPSPLLSHTPSHLFITLLSFYSISNTSPTLQPCRSHWPLQCILSVVFNLRGLWLVTLFFSFLQLLVIFVSNYSMKLLH